MQEFVKGKESGRIPMSGTRTLTADSAMEYLEQDGYGKIMSYWMQQPCVAD